MILVEGQGSPEHPAYSSVTPSLLRGSCPHCLVLCADASGEEVVSGVPRPAPSHIARLCEEVAAPVKPAPVVVMSVITAGSNSGLRKNRSLRNSGHRHQESIPE